MAFRAPSICSRCRRPIPSGQRCSCAGSKTPDPRNLERAKPYATEEWRALRKAQLTRAPHCAICGDRATVADHVKAWKGDRRLFLDPANLQSLCRPCHSRKTAAQDGGFGNEATTPKGCDPSGLPLDPDHPWNRG